MNSFDRITRDIRESKEGRIHRLSGHWELAAGETREDGRHEIDGHRFERVSTDKVGRKMRLISGPAVHCPNPAYTEEYASLREECVCLSVPVAFCRKCQYYRTSRQSRRKYATCGYARTDNPALAAAAEVSGLLSEAVCKAREILK